MQHPGASPSSSLFRQERSPGQSAGRGETHMAFPGDARSATETLSPFPTLSKHLSYSSCCSSSMSWHSIPMASPSPHGIAWPPSHHGAPVALLLA